MAMDWLAGSRMHPLDALATRAGVMTVLVFAGASPSAVALYLAFVSFHAVFIHANFGAELRWLEPFLGDAPLPPFPPRCRGRGDRQELCGPPSDPRPHVRTQFLPDTRWPRAYGVSDGRVESTYLAQILGPFSRIELESALK